MLLTQMLASARRLAPTAAATAAGADPALAAEFHAGLADWERALTLPTAPVWRDGIDALPDDPAALAALWLPGDGPALVVPETMAETSTVPGAITPAQALALQARTGCELSVDLLFDPDSGRVGAFTTCGCFGGVMSNLMFWAWFSGRYAHLPVFHTHPSLENECGERMPSRADWWVMGSLRERLGGGAAGERIYFPDGSCTAYGITGAGDWFHRRCDEDLTRLRPPMPVNGVGSASSGGCLGGVRSRGGSSSR